MGATPDGCHISTSTHYCLDPIYCGVFFVLKLKLTYNILLVSGVQHNIRGMGEKEGEIKMCKLWCVLQLSISSGGFLILHGSDCVRDSNSAGA